MGKKFASENVISASDLCSKRNWDKTATILYPTLLDIPTTAKIDINDPVSCGNIASVILQPVNLEKVAGLVSGDLGEVRGYVMKSIS
ncbi:hypothetical protein [Clostridium estertheticum]|uniref:hypothetical protein n=1 Tax=Clostridium estertheticum TaxID=238834 RepID=UPI00209B3F55|nr:hypothetical protein [Clostridium estertheticum]